MTKKAAKLQVTKAVDAPFEFPPGAALRQVIGVNEDAILNCKLQELSALLWVPEGASQQKLRPIRATLIGHTGN